ncbi:hypothetical protein MAM1_0269c08999 [Mucor ambiguus]|uniref:BZIP domain-containing protein n=1 Tax=Mucor ambiguus TaxID=91626 RepID=A0A0C9LX12_9FUNG|nr:hypothetical protein MAM1_0269c08999 [Mucor ambiguus]
MFSTQSTSVMSIGAITSSDSAKTGCQLPSLCEMTDKVATDAAAVDSSREKQAYVGHWIYNNSTNAPSDRYPTYPMMRTPSSSSLSNRSRFASISMPSPSFSSSSSNASEHDEQDELHHHRLLSHQNHSYQHSRQNSLFSNFESTFGISSSSGSSNSNGGIGRSRSFGSKSDALATRRARNKLASAKYRAKKQALTHAMQDRIMQLATQVMNLREELTITKKSEIEIKARYERLMRYHSTVHTSPTDSAATTTATATTTTRLY